MEDRPALFALYQQLCAVGVPLGLAEFFNAVEALRGGFGAGGRGAVRDTLCALWVRDRDDQVLFDRYFDGWYQAERTEMVARLSTAPQEPELPGTAQQDEAADREAPADSSVSSRRAADRDPPASSIRVQNKLQSFEMRDQQRAARVVELEQVLIDEESLSARPYRLEEIDYPVNMRQMQQSWRYLRRPVRSGPAVEVDIDATIRKIATEGLFLEPVLRPRRVNQVELMLLIDHSDSMIPFRYLAERLVETAVGGGRLGTANVYYFKNVPGGSLYHDRQLTEAEPLDQWLRTLRPERTAVLIFSDAGAARQRLRLPRVEATLDFLTRLSSRARHVAWLNPLPRRRWETASAAAIAQQVPMLPLDRQGMLDAVRVLRGRRPRQQVREGGR